MPQENKISDDLMDALVTEEHKVPPNTAIPPTKETGGLVTPNMLGNLPTPGVEKYNDVPVTQGANTINDVVNRYRRMAEVSTGAGNADVARMATERGGELQDLIGETSNYTSPLALATNLAGPLLSKLGIVGKVTGAGAGALFGGQSLNDLRKPKGDVEPWADYSGRVLNDLAGTAFGAAGVKGSLESKPKEFKQDKAYDHFIKGLSGTGPEFKDLHTDLSNSGHLKEIANTTDITKQNTPEMVKTLRNYLNDWWTKDIQPASERHNPTSKNYIGTTKGLSGNNVVRALNQLIDPQLDQFLPGRAQQIVESMIPYMNKDIPLPVADKLLTILNAESTNLEKMSSEGAEAAKRKSTALATLDTVTDAVRGEYLGTLNQLGEKGIGRARKEYGQLKDLKNLIYNTTQGAEEARAKQPNYDLSLLRRSVQRHPLLTGGMILGAGAEHNPAMLAALPAIEAISTHSEREATPTRQIQEAFKEHKNNPANVVRPSFVPPVQNQPVQQQTQQQTPPPKPTPTVLRFQNGQAIPSSVPQSLNPVLPFHPSTFHGEQGMPPPVVKPPLWWLGSQHDVTPMEPLNEAPILRQGEELPPEPIQTNKIPNIPNPNFSRELPEVKSTEGTRSHKKGPQLIDQSPEAVAERVRKQFSKPIPDVSVPNSLIKSEVKIPDVKPLEEKKTHFETTEVPKKTDLDKRAQEFLNNNKLDEETKKAHEAIEQLKKKIKPGDIELERTSTGAKLGADIPSLAKVLASSLYSRRSSSVIMKELLQNASDAIRTSSNKDITAYTDYSDHSINVHDTGTGMTRKELQTVFTDLGASGKRDISTASGGFGLAKAAPLLMGDHIEVESVVKEKGQLVKHSFTATPEQVVSGFDIHSENVPVGTPTGTKVKVVLPKDMSLYDASRFSDNFNRSLNLPGRFLSESGNEAKKEQGEFTHLSTINAPEANVKLYTTKDHNPMKKMLNNIDVEVNNNGLYQFTKTIYVPGTGVRGVPTRIAIDVSPKVSEGHPDYPFTANRESMRDSLYTKVEEEIQNKIINPALEQQHSEVSNVYKNLPKLMNGVHYLDSGDRLTNQEKSTIILDPAINRISKAINDVGKGMIDAIQEHPRLKNTKIGKLTNRIGIIFSDKVHGLSIKDPESDNRTILINPFTSLDEINNKYEYGYKLYQTLKHELIHDEVSGHYDAFTTMENALESALGKYNIDFANFLIDAVGGEDDSIRKDISKPLQIYNDSIKRETTSPDILRGEESSTRNKTRKFTIPSVERLQSSRKSSIPNVEKFKEN